MLPVQSVCPRCKNVTCRSRQIIGNFKSKVENNKKSKGIRNLVEKHKKEDVGEKMERCNRGRRESDKCNGRNIRAIKIRSLLWGLIK